MDKKLFEDILETVEKINPEIAEGLAVKELRHVEQYMDKVWRSAAASFPPNLYYEGYRRCTPEEENNLLLKRYDSKTYFELAPTDTFIVRYRFRYSDPYSGTDRSFSTDMRLPYVNKANMMKIMGTTYTIMPVTADPVFSASKTDLFLSLNKRNEKFFRFTYNYICDGLKQNATVVWGNMHGVEGGKKKKSKRRNVAVVLPSANKRRYGLDRCPLVLYLFAKFGFTETFAKFGVEAKVITEDQKEDLEPGKWKFCSSSDSKKTSIRGTNTKAKLDTNELVLAIKTDVITTKLKCLIAAFFYITDCFPNKVKPEFVDEERQWQIILGYAVFSEDRFKEGLMIQRIEQHLASLDNYIDIVTKENLIEVGVEVDTIYDLFIYIIVNIQTALLFSNPTTMYNKKIMVLQYLMGDVVASVNMFAFNLNRIKPNALSFTTIQDTLKQNIKMDKIIQGLDRHREIVLVNSSCDTVIYEHTAKMILQSQITGKNNKNVQTAVEDKNIDISVAEVCSYGNHSKKEPTGRGMLNLYVKILPNGMIERSERLRPLLDETDRKIKTV